MQIFGVGKIGNAQNIKKKAGGTEGNFAEFLDAAESGEAKKTSATTNVAGLNFINEVNNDEEQRKKKREAVAYGNDVLDELDAIRKALMMGGLNKDQLVRIQQKLASQNRDSIDPDLDFLINEIEVRAAVELAKLGIF